MPDWQSELGLVSLRESEVLQNRYHILKILKSGGMGSVYLAQDSNLDGLCAVKEMHPTDDGWVHRRFREEAQILSQLQHANILRVRDFFQLERPEGMLSYIVMDYVKGDTLAQEFEACSKTQMGLSEQAGRTILATVLSVLEYLHGLPTPIIHRDIKPANIIRETDSQKIFLVDFGLARGASEHTQTTAGTMMFCSPEQMLGKADARSDLYSLGATAYVLLTGQNIQMGRYISVGYMRQDLDPQLAAVIDKVLQLDPAQRFQSAAQMLQALSAAPKSKKGPLMLALAVGGVCSLGLLYQLQPPAKPATAGQLSPTPISTPSAIPSSSASPSKSPGSGSPSPGQMFAGVEASASSLPPLPKVTPQLVAASALPTWSVREVINEQQFSEASMRLWLEVNTFARANSVNGLYYLRYHEYSPPDRIDMEVGVVLPDKRPGQGRITASELPAGKTAKLTHVGPYGRLTERFGELRHWADGQGLKPRAAPYALYVISASSERDLNKWSTDVCLPVKD